MAGGEKPCIMVCAPSNKAISVLSARFLDYFEESNSTFSAIMCGDADKLLADEMSNHGDDGSSKLRSIFCYSWLDNLTTEYNRIKDDGSPRRNRQHLFEKARKLQKRLENCLPAAGTVSNRHLKCAAKITARLDPSGSVRQGTVILESEFVNLYQSLNALGKQSKGGIPALLMSMSKAKSFFAPFLQLVMTVYAIARSMT